MGLQFLFYTEKLRPGTYPGGPRAVAYFPRTHGYWAMPDMAFPEAAPLIAKMLEWAAVEVRKQGRVPLPQSFPETSESLTSW